MPIWEDHKVDQFGARLNRSVLGPAAGKYGKITLTVKEKKLGTYA